MKIRVIIADDHPVVREGLRMAIERCGKDVEIVGEASDGLEVLKLARMQPIDVYILDVTMPKMNGIETTRELHRTFPGAKVLILSMHDTKEIVEEAFSSGALGFLTKEIATRRVAEATAEVHAGHFYISPAIAHFVVEAGLLIKKGRAQRPPHVVLAHRTGAESVATDS